MQRGKQRGMQRRDAAAEDPVEDPPEDGPPSLLQGKVFTADEVELMLQETRMSERMRWLGQQRWSKGPSPKGSEVDQHGDEEALNSITSAAALEAGTLRAVLAKAKAASQFEAMLTGAGDNSLRVEVERLRGDLPSQWNASSHPTPPPASNGPRPRLPPRLLVAHRGPVPTQPCWPWPGTICQETSA